MTLVLSADHTDELGGLMFSRLHLVLSDPSLAELEAAVLGALEGNCFGVNLTEQERRSNWQRVLDAAHARTTPEYERRLQNVAISRRGDEFEVAPMRREPSGGFVALKDDAVSLVAPRPGELGAEIERALRRLV